ncbi:MAG: 4Fe-4S dicluster domain-containing protein, partial [bacterium]
CTVQVPVGTSLADTLRLAGVSLPSDFWVLTGGVMMGNLPKSLDEPVTRTTGAIIVLPSDHQVLTRYRRPQVEIDRIGRSACDQCSFCTELCPRFLLGHPIEPHRAMRSLGFAIDKTPQVLGTLYCCECNLCTMIACPEDLDPKNVCTDNKRRLIASKTPWPGDRMSRTKPNAMFEGRRTPVTRLIKKLNLRKFENIGPLSDLRGEPESVRIPTKMHIGAPADPCVQAGAKVAIGDVIARIGADALGVDIHASIGGTVEQVSEREIVIRRV